MPKKVIKRAAEEARETVKKTVGRLAEEPAMMAKSLAAQLGFTKEDLESNPLIKMKGEELEQEKAKRKQASDKLRQEIEQKLQGVRRQRAEQAMMAEQRKKAEEEEEKKEEIPPPPVTGEKKKRGLAPWIPHRARQKMGTAEVTPGAHG
jgi:hypothetical protein